MALKTNNLMSKVRSRHTRGSRPTTDRPEMESRTTEPPPPHVVGLRPEVLWRDGPTAVLVFPDGQEFATDIRQESLATKVVTGAIGPDARLIKVGDQSLWGDVRWTCFSVDPSSVGEESSVVRGVASTKSAAVSFEMSCDTSSGEPIFLSGVPSEEDDGYDDESSSATRLLSSGMRTGHGLKCSVKENDEGHALVALCASDRECAVFAWRLTADEACHRWRWMRSGDIKFVLPVGFKGNLLDCTELDGECVVVRQPGLPDLRFELDESEIAADSGAGTKWSYGDAVWDIVSPGDNLPSLASRLDRSVVSIICCPNDLPELAEAWRGAGLAAAKTECERIGACPVYIYIRRDASNQGLKALFGSVVADRILLVLEIAEPSEQRWMGGDEIVSEDVRDLIRDMREVAGRGGDAFKCVVIGQPAACDYIHSTVEDYVATASAGPYTEMPDAFVARCVGRGTGVPDDVIEEAYAEIREHCLSRWETSLVDDDGDRFDPSLPFMLPVAQAQRVLREAAAESEGHNIVRRVRSKLSEMGGGPPEMPQEMKRRLAELPLLLRDSGGEVLYGQDEAIWATQRHLQAHILRAAENKPTFIFYVGVNGLGKTTLAINSIRALGGTMEEINCASLDNAYGYGGERAGVAALNRKVDALRASPSPLKALLLDEVDKNPAVLKALIRLTDSDAVTARGMLDHPMAGIFVFITLNVVPDCSEHRKFIEEDEPGPRMERLRDLIVASVKNTGDSKVVHAIISRLIPYLVVFNELGTDGDRSRRYMVSLAEDEVRGFANEYGIRVVLDDDALTGLVKRSATFSLGGFRSVRSAMRREIESAVGDMYTQRKRSDSTVVLRDAGTHLSAVSAEDGDTVLYAIAITRHKRISTAVKDSLDRTLEQVRLRDDDKLRLDHLDVLAAAFGYLADVPLFSIEGSEAKFVFDDTVLMGITDDEDRTRLLKASLAELKRKVAHHTREILESGQQQVDAVMESILDEARRFYRLSLPDDMSGQRLLSTVPAWAMSAWKGYIKAERGVSSKADAVKEAFREMTAEWSHLVADQEDSMSDVLKFPELRARAAKRSAEIARSLPARAERLGLDKDALAVVNDMAIDAMASAEKKLTEKDILKELELESGSFAEPPMSVHLMAGAATAFLVDRLIRDMLREDYSVADRERTEERFREPHVS